MEADTENQTNEKKKNGAVKICTSENEVNHYSRKDANLDKTPIMGILIKTQQKQIDVNEMPVKINQNKDDHDSKTLELDTENQTNEKEKNGAGKICTSENEVNHDTRKDANLDKTPIMGILIKTQQKQIDVNDIPFKINQNKDDQDSKTMEVDTKNQTNEKEKNDAVKICTSEKEVNHDFQKDNEIQTKTPQEQIDVNDMPFKINQNKDDQDSKTMEVETENQTNEKEKNGAVKICTSENEVNHDSPKDANLDKTPIMGILIKTQQKQIDVNDIPFKIYQSKHVQDSKIMEVDIENQTEEKNKNCASRTCTNENEVYHVSQEDAVLDKTPIRKIISFTPQENIDINDVINLDYNNGLSNTMSPYKIYQNKDVQHPKIMEVDTENRTDEKEKNDRSRTCTIENEVNHDFREDGALDKILTRKIFSTTPHEDSDVNDATNIEYYNGLSHNISPHELCQNKDIQDTNITEVITENRTDKKKNNDDIYTNANEKKYDSRGDVSTNANEKNYLEKNVTKKSGVAKKLIYICSPKMKRNAIKFNDSDTNMPFHGQIMIKQGDDILSNEYLKTIKWNDNECNYNDMPYKDFLGVLSALTPEEFTAYQRLADEAESELDDESHSEFKNDLSNISVMKSHKTSANLPKLNKHTTVALKQLEKEKNKKPKTPLNNGTKVIDSITKSDNEENNTISQDNSNRKKENKEHLAPITTENDENIVSTPSYSLDNRTEVTGKKKIKKPKTLLNNGTKVIDDITKLNNKENKAISQDNSNKKEENKKHLAPITTENDESIVSTPGYTLDNGTNVTGNFTKSNKKENNITQDKTTRKEENKKYKTPLHIGTKVIDNITKSNNKQNNTISQDNSNRKEENKEHLAPSTTENDENIVSTPGYTLDNVTKVTGNFTKSNKKENNTITQDKTIRKEENKKHKTPLNIGTKVIDNITKSNNKENKAISQDNSNKKEENKKHLATITTENDESIVSTPGYTLDNGTKVTGNFTKSNKKENNTITQDKTTRKEENKKHKTPLNIGTKVIDNITKSNNKENKAISQDNSNKKEENKKHLAPITTENDESILSTPGYTLDNGTNVTGNFTKWNKKENNTITQDKTTRKEENKKPKTPLNNGTNVTGNFTKSNKKENNTITQDKTTRKEENKKPKTPLNNGTKVIDNIIKLNNKENKTISQDNSNKKEENKEHLAQITTENDENIVSTPGYTLDNETKVTGNFTKSNKKENNTITQDKTTRKEENKKHKTPLNIGTKVIDNITKSNNKENKAISQDNSNKKEENKKHLAPITTENDESILSTPGYTLDNGTNVTGNFTKWNKKENNTITQDKTTRKEENKKPKTPLNNGTNVTGNFTKSNKKENNTITQDKTTRKEENKKPKTPLNNGTKVIDNIIKLNNKENKTISQDNSNKKEENKEHMAQITTENDENIVSTPGYTLDNEQNQDNSNREEKINKEHLAPSTTENDENIVSTPSYILDNGTKVIDNITKSNNKKNNTISQDNSNREDENKKHMMPLTTEKDESMVSTPSYTMKNEMEITQGKSARKEGNKKQMTPMNNGREVIDNITKSTKKEENRKNMSPLKNGTKVIDIIIKSNNKENNTDTVVKSNKKEESDLNIVYGKLKYNNNYSAKREIYVDNGDQKDMEDTEEIKKFYDDNEDLFKDYNPTETKKMIDLSSNYSADSMDSFQRLSRNSASAVQQNKTTNAEESIAFAENSEQPAHTGLLPLVISEELRKHGDDDEWKEQMIKNITDQIDTGRLKVSGNRWPLKLRAMKNDKLNKLKNKKKGFSRTQANSVIGIEKNKFLKQFDEMLFHNNTAVFTESMQLSSDGTTTIEYQPNIPLNFPVTKIEKYINHAEEKTNAGNDHRNKSIIIMEQASKQNSNLQQSIDVINPTTLRSNELASDDLIRQENETRIDTPDFIEVLVQN
ncbi:probable serine/threonine-protein kinase DDB_G0282963 [Ctenocephalides felis]|uniref:probable serine/threonine-protein kinase DDB_G0282963 n=1 Tax=Ctenocephalides felis TaxID=7515 RepID=UPI000E6E43A0|nr:probable serine/threonine-protein kinase DDB_G0282963 [Ctenocephalides felis]